MENPIYAECLHGHFSEHIFWKIFVFLTLFVRNKKKLKQNFLMLPLDFLKVSKDSSVTVYTNNGNSYIGKLNEISSHGNLHLIQGIVTFPNNETKGFNSVFIYGNAIRNVVLKPELIKEKIIEHRKTEQNSPLIDENGIMRQQPRAQKTNSFTESHRQQYNNSNYNQRRNNFNNRNYSRSGNYNQKTANKE